ncbi:MAG: phosphatase PAP2 family protein [Lentisphaeraceae bacterium]|nr:phosphatase PAP2 family protein [Lentisphaeraceae bacterium]
MKSTIVVLLTVIVLFTLDRFFLLDVTVSDFLFSITGFKDSLLLSIFASLAPVLPVVAACFIIWLHKGSKKLIFIEVILLMAAAPLLVHFILKPVFKRPRPVDISQYNENSEISFVKAGDIGPKGRSFPSGHSTMAFSLMFLFFLRQNKEGENKISLLLPGLVWGFYIGMIRMLQGRHFLTDIIASFTVAFFCGLLISYSISKLKLSYE